MTVAVWLDMPSVSPRSHDEEVGSHQHPGWTVDGHEVPIEAAEEGINDSHHEEAGHPTGDERLEKRVISLIAAGGWVFRRQKNRHKEGHPAWESHEDALVDEV